MRDKLVLIDGSNFVCRAFYAVYNNKSINPLRVFYSMLVKAIKDAQSQYLVILFDCHADTFRKKIYPLYKAQREAFNPQLVSFLLEIKESLKAKKIMSLEKIGYEADDLIATITSIYKNDLEVNIYSSDKDLLQLVDINVNVHLLKNNDNKIIYRKDNFYFLVGCDPCEIIVLKALMGDKSDNYLGINGIGKITALKLINEYHTLVNIYNNIASLPKRLQEKLQQGKDDALLGEKLAQLDNKIPLNINLKELTFNLKELNDLSHAEKG